MRRNRCTYWILFVVFLRVHIQARGTASSHSLISVLSCQESVLLLAVVDTLDDLRSDERAFCDNTLKRNHPIQVGGTQCPRIAGKFTEGSNKCTIVPLSAD